MPQACKCASVHNNIMVHVQLGPTSPFSIPVTVLSEEGSEGGGTGGGGGDGNKRKMEEDEGEQERSAKNPRSASPDFTMLKVADKLWRSVYMYTCIYTYSIHV